MVGLAISHYSLIDKLGEGGMGVVYKAKDTKLERLVALKLLPPHLLGNDDVRKRFEREAKSAAALSHANICHVYEIDEADGQSFIAMSLIEGESLDQKIGRGPLKLEEALSIARQVAKGLEAAHKRGIVHRDIKPENIMVGDDGHVTIMDFGLAQLNEASRLTKTDETLGTVAYMSPEQTEGSGTDHRADIWSLGVVLYEMVTGQPPFKGDYDKAVMYSILNEDPEPVTAIRAGVPMELEVVIAKCLQKDQASRYQAVNETTVDLENLSKKIEGGKSSRSRTPPRPQSVSTESKTRISGVAMLPWALLVVACIGLAVTSWRPGPNSTVASLGADYALRQVTFDSGLSLEPAISPDGGFVAYTSNRSKRGDLDVWVKQLAAGEPIRLTDDPADDRSPAISPDGSTVAFRSDRDPPGVYLAPLLGGDARLVARDGRGPKFSPDGNWISYWTGAINNRSVRRAHVVATVGGEPKEILLPERTLVHPVFFGPKPGELTVVSTRRRVEAFDLDSGQTRELDWSALSFRPLGSEGGFSLNHTSEWFVAAGQGDLWKIPYLSQGTVGQGVRLTYGPSAEDGATVDQAGRIAFSSAEVRVNVWSLPVNTSSGESLGPAERVTDYPGIVGHIDATPGADALAYVGLEGRPGQGTVYYREIAGGEDRAVVPDGMLPIIAPGARKLIYTRPDRTELIEVSLTDGSRRTLCEGRSCNAVAGSSDGSKLLVSGGLQRRWDLLDTSSGERIENYLAHPDSFVYDPQFSPDDRWVAFHATVTPETRKIVVAPATMDSAIAPEDWISITDGTEMTRAPRWSPDGDLLYFLSEEGGYRAIDAIRLDPSTKQPRGDRFVVAQFRNAARYVEPDTGNRDAFVVTKNRIFVSLRETSGNVWLLEPTAK